MNKYIVSGIYIDGMPVWDVIYADNATKAIRIAEDAEHNLEMVKIHKNLDLAMTRIDRLEKELTGITKPRYQKPEWTTRKNEGGKTA